MKLTTKNVMKFLKQNDVEPCTEGMKALNKLLRQKKSMEFVFNKMLNMRTTENQISYAQWLYNQVHIQLWRGHRDQVVEPVPSRISFSSFRRLFNKLSVA